MMTLWWLMTALAAPAETVDPSTEAGWVEVVARSTNPTSARWTGAEAAPHWEGACASGRKAACAVRDGATVKEALAVVCPFDEAGLPISGDDTDTDPAACLGRYWLVERRDPERAFFGYRALCDQGVDRGCAEVARLHIDGLGTFESQRRARRMAEPLCADGVAAACIVIGRLDRTNRPRRAADTFEAAIELGDATAIWDKAEVVAITEVAESLRQRACDAGHPDACLDIAQDLSGDQPEAAQELVGRACDLGSPAGCVKDVLSKYMLGVLPKREVASRLESLCLEYDDACLHAGFLGFGGDVRAFFPGHYADTEMHRITGQIVPFARDCLRDFRDRHPEWDREVELDLEMWVDEEGVVQGVLPVTDADREYQQCVAEHSLRVTTKALPTGGAARIHDAMTLGMESDIVVYTFKGASGSKQVEDLEKLAYEDWTGPANACYMDNGGSAWDDVFTWVYGEIMKDGTFVGTKLIESSGDEPTDACILDMLQGITLDKQYVYNEKVRIYIRFNVVYRAPRERRYHGKAADPDTYMYEAGDIPPDWD